MALKASAPSWYFLDTSELYYSYRHLNSFPACREGTEVSPVPTAPGTLLLMPGFPKAISPWGDKRGERGQEPHSPKGWAALLQILLVVKRDERERSVERESALDRIYVFFLPAPRETFESLRAAFHIVTQVELL